MEHCSAEGSLTARCRLSPRWGHQHVNTHTNLHAHAHIRSRVGMCASGALFPLAALYMEAHSLDIGIASAFSTCGPLYAKSKAPDSHMHRCTVQCRHIWEHCRGSRPPVGQVLRQSWHAAVGKGRVYKYRGGHTHSRTTRYWLGAQNAK